MKTLLFLIVLFSAFSSGYGQRTALQAADQHLQKFEYAAAVDLYEKILLQDPANVAVIESLSLCYNKLNEPLKAEAWLKKLCERPDVKNSFVKMYAQVLASNGKYDQSARWYKRYSEATNDNSVMEIVTSYKNIEAFYRDSTFYKIEKLALNSDESDFGPAFYEDAIVFCSARDNGQKSKFQWDNSSFLDLYRVKDLQSTPESLGKPLNSPLHEGPVVFSPFYDTIYFTRNSNTGKQQSSVNLKLFYSVQRDGAWSKPLPLSFNNDQYSVGHPALHGSTLYFVSDMPGGRGGTDIYTTTLVNGSWTTPVNLGAEINTPENEMFPFVSKEGDLYFATRGLPGLGGLDVFHAKNQDGKFLAPHNMGYPINTAKDDFSLIIKGNHAFLSSNRTGTTGDDIFAVTIDKTKSLSIQAVNMQGQTLDNATFTLTVNDKCEILHGPDAIHSFLCTDDYLLTTQCEKYISRQITLSQEDLCSKKAGDTIRITLKEATKQISLDLTSMNGKQLSGGTIQFRDITSGRNKVHTVATGKTVSEEIIAGHEYELEGSKIDYKSKRISIKDTDFDSYENGAAIVVSLASTSSLFEKNEVGQIIELDIKYDVGKYTIRTDAAKELDKLAIFLQKNPGVKVELGSHTDTRGSDESNLRLSQKRAESAVRYIVAKGINSKRLIPIGYGKDDLKIKNAVSEQDHQQNRRTTVKIVGL